MRGQSARFGPARESRGEKKRRWRTGCLLALLFCCRSRLAFDLELRRGDDVGALVPLLQEQWAKCSVPRVRTSKICKKTGSKDFEKKKFNRRLPFFARHQHDEEHPATHQRAVRAHELCTDCLSRNAGWEW